MMTSGRSSAALDETARNLPVPFISLWMRARLLVEHGAVGAHHAERQLALAAVVDEIGAQIGDRVELGKQHQFDLGLGAVALRFVDQVGDDGGAARLQRALRVGAADHVDVLDLGHLVHQFAGLVGGGARVLQPAAGRQLQREDDAAGVLLRDEARRQQADRIDRADEEADAGKQRQPAEAQRRLQQPADSRA